MGTTAVHGWEYPDPTDLAGVLTTGGHLRQMAQQIEASLVANYPSMVVATGVGIDPTGGSDSTAALQDLIDQAAGDARPLWLPPGTYKAAGLEVPAPLTIIGSGHLGPSLDTIPTKIVCDSATETCIQVNEHGVTMQDLAIVNTYAGDPTAGAGVEVTSGFWANLTRCAVIGFYDLIDIDNAWYYNLTDCHFFDAVRDYAKVGNSVSGDVGGGKIRGCSFSVCFVDDYGGGAGRAADDVIHWSSGGGLFFQGNKINGASALNGAPYTFAKPTNGLHCAVGNGIHTVDILAQGNSVEAIDNAAFRISQDGTTGELRNILIEDNQVQNADYGVLINPASVSDGTNYIQDLIIGGNVFENVSRSIKVSNACRILIAPNLHTNIAVRVVEIDAGASKVVYHQQLFSGDDIDIFQYVTADDPGVKEDFIDHRWHREISHADSTLYQTLWIFAPEDTGGGVMDLTLSGRCAGVGPWYWNGKRAFIRNGGVTLTTLGSDAASANFTTGVEISLDTASVSGEVAVKVRLKAAGGGTLLSGRCEMQLNGNIRRVHKGA